MFLVRDRSGPPPAGRKRALLLLSLVLVATVGCTDEGSGSTDGGGDDTDRTTTGATGSTATGTTGGDETGTTGGTGETNATGATGGTGDAPPEFEITLASDCSLQTNSDDGGPYLLVFAIDLENVGGPYGAETGTVVTSGLAPLSGNSDKLVGYDEVIEGIVIQHDLEESALGKTGIIEIRAFGETRGLSVTVPDALGPAGCHLA